MPRWLRERLDLHHHAHSTSLCVGPLRTRTPVSASWMPVPGKVDTRRTSSASITSASTWRSAIRRWNYSGLDVVGDLGQLPFCAGTFDLALCLEVLEHLPEPQQALTELARVLRSGGRLNFSVPMSWHQHQKPHDYYRYTSFGLRYLLDRAGFDVCELRPTGGYFWFLSIQFQMLSLWVFPARQAKWLRLGFVAAEDRGAACFLPPACRCSATTWTGWTARRIRPWLGPGRRCVDDPTGSGDLVSTSAAGT